MTPVFPSAWSYLMSFHAAESSRSQFGQYPRDVGPSVSRGEGERVTLLPFGSSVSDALNIRQECMANTQKEIHTYLSGSPLGLLTNNDWPQILMLVKTLGGTRNCPVDGGKATLSFGYCTRLRTQLFYGRWFEICSERIDDRLDNQLVEAALPSNTLGVLWRRNCPR